jgi:hypothetical protein
LKQQFQCLLIPIHRNNFNGLSSIILSSSNGASSSAACKAGIPSWQKWITLLYFPVVCTLSTVVMREVDRWQSIPNGVVVVLTSSLKEHECWDGSCCGFKWQDDDGYVNENDILSWATCISNRCVGLSLYSPKCLHTSWYCWLSCNNRQELLASPRDV